MTPDQQTILSMLKDGAERRPKEIISMLVESMYMSESEAFDRLSSKQARDVLVAFISGKEEEE